MVQIRSRLEVADNTGARMATMIGVIGKATLYARIGDVITANVKEASPTGTVKKGEVVRAVLVRTITRVPHPKFGKIVKQIRRFYAHDEENKAKTGDTVRIMETRPLSKLKRWRLVEVLQK